MTYGRSREAKTLEESIFLTTPAPEMRMIMKEMEEELSSEDGARRQQRKRALPHTQRRRTKLKIKWSQFS